MLELLVLGFDFFKVLFAIQIKIIWPEKEK